MKSNDLLNMIDDTETKKTRKGIKPRHGIAIAASFCLIIGSIATVYATGFGTRLIEFFSSHEAGSDYKESGFDLSISIERIREDALSEEIQNVGNTIKQQFTDYTPVDNWFPGDWQTNFESRNEACEYIGLKQIKMFPVDYEEQATTLSVSGNEQGKILEVGIETDYNVDDVRMQFFTQIFTKNYDEEIIVGTRTTDDIECTESHFTTDDNIQCHVIYETAASESGYLSMDGYIVENGILYNLHIMYLEKDLVQAEELLHQWAEEF